MRRVYDVFAPGQTDSDHLPAAAGSVRGGALHRIPHGQGRGDRAGAAGAGGTRWPLGDGNRQGPVDGGPSGEIHGLAWNGISLEEIWRTRKIDGYIVDYQVVPDPANPAKAELFVGVVLGGELESVLSGGGQSTVLMYSLDTTAGQ